MVLAKRERIILIIAIAAVASLALYHWAFSAVALAMANAGNDKAKAAKELKVANDAIAMRDQLTPKWNDWVKSGLKSDPAEAEYQVMGSILDWAKAEGVVLKLQKPERQSSKSRLPEIVVEATGTGTQKAIAGLLNRIENAKIPIKVIFVHLVATKETVDDLSVTIRLSTVYMAARSPISATTSAPAERSGARR